MEAKKESEKATRCCACKSEVDVEKHDIPPKWYGTYVGSELKKVMCAECMSKPERKAEWRK